MSQLAQIINFSDKFSDNILPATAIFTDGNTPVNITSGTGGISFFKDSLFGYGIVVFNTDFDTTDLSFNFGDALKTTITEAGVYRLQMSIFDFDSGANTFLPFDFEILVYRNGVFSETLEGTFDFDAATHSGKSVTFCQEVVCDGSVFELDFSFVMKKDLTSPVSNNSVRFCNLKLELDNKFLGVVSPYSLPFDYISKNTDLHIAETAWSVPDVGAQVVANGASLNLFTLINNVTNKDNTNSDVYDQLDITTNAIKTTYRGCKIIHTIRVSFNIITGTDQFYQLQIRRAIDDSIVYRSQLQRNTDETIQTVEMTTRTLSNTDPFTIDGFYIAFVNNSGFSATIDDALSIVIISHYQKSQPQ